MQIKQSDFPLKLFINTDEIYDHSSLYCW